MDNNDKYTILPDGYNQLAIAVVQQAAEDYKTEYRRYCRSGKRSSRLDEVETWLQSGEGDLYSFGKGVIIMQMIREEVDRQVRRGRGPNRRIEYNGVTKTFKQWADEYGIAQHRLAQRLSNGWTMEEALTIPKGARRGTTREDQEV